MLRLTARRTEMRPPTADARCGGARHGRARYGRARYGAAWYGGARPGHVRRGRGLAILLAALAAAPVVALASAEPASADSVRNAQSWVLSMLNVQPAWQVTEGRGVVVAVIDSGVNPDVSDLTGSVTTEKNFSGVDTPESNPSWGIHGTWMASLIAGHGHPGAPGDIGSSGIVGTAPGSTIMSLRVITDPTDPAYAAYQRESAGRGQRELARAIVYAVGHGAGVISLSLGYSEQSRVVRLALQDAYDHNVVVVASAGNSGDAAGAGGRGHAPYSFPANYPGVLAVAAVNSAGQVSSFSSQNLSVQVAAPGFRVPAQGRDGQYWYVTGTSPACALTAGVVALIKARYPDLTDSQVITAITSSTTPASRPPGGYDQQIGFGIVNAAAALTAAGKLAAAGGPPVTVAASSHFGGGIRAIPAPPVKPRGPADLILYCLLGAACLAMVALATSRLLVLRDAATDGPAGRQAPAQPPDGGSAASGPVTWRPATEHPGAAWPGEGWRAGAASPQPGLPGQGGNEAPQGARHAAQHGRDYDGRGPE